MSSAGVILLCVLALPFVLGLLSYLGKLWTEGQQQAHELEVARLEALSEALRQPQLDQRTRDEVLRLLAEAQQHAGFVRRHGGLGGLLQRAVLIVGWFAFVMGLGLGLYGWLSGMYSRPDPASVSMALIGFALLSLPMAIREMMGRSKQHSSPAR